MGLFDAKSQKIAPAFTDRFQGLFDLQAKRQAGQAITVPTIAEFVKSEAQIGDMLRSSGLGDLATDANIGKVLGQAKSVNEVANLINDVFNTIDNAPSILKADLYALYPGMDRTTLAKALLTGKEGAAELSKKVAAATAVSAGNTQGVKITQAMGGDIAGMGYNYQQQLTGFKEVSQLGRGGMLGKMSGIDLTQEESISSVFGQNAAAAEKIRKIKEGEQNRFQGSAGRLASSNRNLSGLL